MTTQVATEQHNFLQHFADVFSEFESSLNGRAGSAWHEVQRSAFQTLQETDFPDRRHEDWKYTPVAKLLSPKYVLAGSGSGRTVPEVPGMDAYVLHIQNGRLETNETQLVLLSLGIQITPIHEAFALPSWQEVFGNLVSGKAGDVNSAFTNLNFSFNTHGFFLDIPANTILDKPIELRIMHDDTVISFSHPLYFIRVGKGSQVTILERFETQLPAMDSVVDGFINCAGFIHLGANAHATHIKWQALPPHQHLVYSLLVTQQRDSHFENLAFDLGGQLVRNTIEVELEESNTFTSLQAGFMASARQSMDHQTRINHKVPHGESHELYRGIITDQASAAFNGKVYVHPDAQKTNAFQQNDALVLSPHAIMNSKPQLEIFADDVKCSHGATIGQLDEKALFYLRTRGLDPTVATYMLKAAFLDVVLEKIPLEPVRQYITSKLTRLS
jgi:Fe-S cluster assembly protein SufD